MIKINVDDFANQLIVTNQIITGNKPSKTTKQKLLGCFSSYHYYNSNDQQISSIVLSIIKNHCFVDGNKRTALVALDTLCIINNTKRAVSNDDIDDVIVDIAAHKYTVGHVAKILFSVQ